MGMGGLILTKAIIRHSDLRVYQLAFQSAMSIFHLSKSFTAEEKFSLTDQIRRSSRSVAANIAEAWRKRRYEKSFIAKLSDAEAEAAETQTWLDFAKACGYIEEQQWTDLIEKYEYLISMLVKISNSPENWVKNA